jgi:hypothetical protein
MSGKKLEKDRVVGRLHSSGNGRLKREVQAKRLTREGYKSYELTLFCRSAAPHLQKHSPAPNPDEVPRKWRD